jgi:proton-dependent oligopeptide transporter, POT family
MTEVSAAPNNAATWFGHPKGLFVCFSTEMWERFSFYGMKYLLVLYLTKYHLFSDEDGLGIFAAYVGMVYAMPFIGGMLADRYLGTRKAVLFGGLLLVFGHLGMAIEGTQAAMVNGAVVRDESALRVFYLSLSLIIVGVGFLKPNISTVVGQLYGEKDARRDSGFTIFYMGINAGSLLALIICTWLGETYGWRYGFGAAGIGMVIGLIIFAVGNKHLAGRAEPPNPALLKEKTAVGLTREASIYVGGVFGVLVVWQLMTHTATVHYLLNSVMFGVFVWLVWFIAKLPSDERRRMTALSVMIIFSIVFWTLFEQSSASMTLFADRVLDRQVAGFTPTASQVGVLNPAFVVLLGPVFAFLWIALAKRAREPSTPTKFALGIIQAGLGFGALVIGAQFPDSDGKVAMIWMVLAYMLHTTGELCVSPVGLSAVTKLSVPRVVGVMMGTWFLATAYAEWLAAQLSKIAAIKTVAGEVANVGEALATYTHLFSIFFVVGIGIGVVLLMLSPWIRRQMQDVH